MDLQIKIIGGLLILLAMLHLIFPKYFNWKQELSSLSLVNRQIMYVHTFFIAFVVFLMGLLWSYLINRSRNNNIGSTDVFSYGYILDCPVVHSILWVFVKALEKETI
jgi:hypothetical protein